MYGPNSRKDIILSIIDDFKEAKKRDLSDSPLAMSAYDNHIQYHANRRLEVIERMNDKDHGTEVGFWPKRIKATWES
jgi:hypothetical protein